MLNASQRVYILLVTYSVVVFYNTVTPSLRLRLPPVYYLRTTSNLQTLTTYYFFEVFSFFRVEDNAFHELGVFPQRLPAKSIPLISIIYYTYAIRMSKIRMFAFKRPGLCTLPQLTQRER